MFSHAVDQNEIGTVADVFADGLVFVELCSQLVEVGDGDVRADSDVAAVWLQLVEQDFQERRLADTVGTDQADTVAAKNSRRQVADNQLVVVAERNVVRLADQHAGPFGVLELHFRLADFVAPLCPNFS